MIASSLLLAASTATLPRYRAGDAFVFSDGRVERVIRVRGDTITWSGLTGANYARSRNFAVPVLAWRSGRGNGRREIRGTPGDLWPLGTPRSVRFRVIAETRTKPTAAWRRTVTLWTCKSQKARLITVKLGTYEAIPVTCDRYSGTSMRLIERLSWSYAPALSHYVQRSSIDYIRGTKTSIEMTAALTGPAANQRRLAALSREARQTNRTSSR